MEPEGPYRVQKNAALDPNIKQMVRFQVLTAESMKMAGCLLGCASNLVEVYRRFRGACCLPEEMRNVYRI
jgi:hypothetical protein